MRNTMRVILIAASALVLVTGSICVGAPVMGRKIFDGNLTLKEAGITLGSWGSGTADESTEQTLSSRAIRIASQGFFSGGRIDFARPVVLYSEPPSKNDYLCLMVSFTARDTIQNVIEYADPLTRPRVGKIRLVLYPADGPNLTPIETIIPATANEQDGWWPIAVPLTSLKVPAGTKELKIRRMLIFSDLPDVMYVGEIGIVTDTTPIRVEPLEDHVSSTTVASNDLVGFNAVATGGISPLAYYWDFDDRDGIQEDGYGEQISHSFKKPARLEAQEYSVTVTLTVKDVFGVKAPAKTTVKITVND